MADFEIKLNQKNIGKLLKSAQFAAAVNRAADAIAAEIGEDAKVYRYTTDRKAAAVGVPGELQARDGALTRAAAKVGLEVRAKK
ncbi:hypothetical protein NONO_c17840 [Nocardia nova SH22a]|uniref:Bacteriophage protein n=1 Tax=Nocardia nova SH22a TaxID=1415166 RepID=W5TBP2_9NOCA|nr:hypothetical protein [Nocardia nova]AHH16584.1 hypothetical protein NONO_c17840 [Nocardia nova SH22a]